MSISVQIKAGTTDGRTMKAFQDTINQRMKYLNQTARQSIIATAIDVLKSIRTSTRVAKKSSVNVNVIRDGSLYASVTKQGKTPEFCLRVKGTNQRYVSNETVIRDGKLGKISKVFRYTNTTPKMTVKERNYIIIANTLSEAKAIARKIALSPIIRYSGLAKRAIGILMHKTASSFSESNEKVGTNVRKVAYSMTACKELVKESESGGTYTLDLTDNLRYAIDAVIGGRAGVNTAFKKALNKIVGNINHRIKGSDFWGNGKIETPFPEIMKAR